MKLVVNTGLGDKAIDLEFEKIFGNSGQVRLTDLVNGLRRRFNGYLPLEVVDDSDPNLKKFETARLKMYELKDGIVYKDIVYETKVRDAVQAI